MDLRIVNTCNNDCLYCLEQEYRDKEKFISFEVILKKLKENKDKKITFYWWNPLLHPDIEKIVLYAKNYWYESIGLLTNTQSLNIKLLKELINNWLQTIWFYFNTFDEKKHDIIVNNGIKLEQLLNNIELMKESWILYKSIIHINLQNIKTLYKDIIILNKKYKVENFEFINYFPFDRPYEKYKDMLRYNIKDNQIYINTIFKVIEKLGLKVRFIKFSKDFFGKNKKYYDYENWILWQIWDEDIDRLNIKEPFCLRENRCDSCFIKDCCEEYKQKT